MNTTEHIALIKAHLNKLLEIAEKRTPGEWAITHREPGYSSRAPRNVIGPPGSMFEPGVVRTFIATSHINENADFIAACAGNAERGWRSTLAALDSLRMENRGSMAALTGREEHLLNTILAEWPIESLK